MLRASRAAALCPLPSPCQLLLFDVLLFFRGGGEGQEPQAEATQTAALRYAFSWDDGPDPAGSNSKARGPCCSHPWASAPVGCSAGLSPWHKPRQPLFLHYQPPHSTSWICRSRGSASPHPKAPITSLGCSAHAHCGEPAAHTAGFAQALQPAPPFSGQKCPGSCMPWAPSPPPALTRLPPPTFSAILSLNQTSGVPSIRTPPWNKGAPSHWEAQ